MKGFLKPLFAGILFCGMAGSAYAQHPTLDSSNNNMKMSIKKPKPLRREFSVGVRLYTDGWGIHLDRGAVSATGKNSDIFYDIQLLQLEFDEHKNPKEIRRTNNLGSVNNNKTRPFAFGKVNNFYTLKIGYGKRKMIAGKPEQGNISVHWVYMGGISLGLLKPYYIDAYVPQGGVLTETSIKYSDSTKQTFLTKNYIIGSSGFSKGLGEISIVPGIHIKTALHFDFATSKYRKAAIETGINAEFYTKGIEIMANQKAQPYFVNVYASVQFGKRW